MHVQSMEVILRDAYGTGTGRLWILRCAHLRGAARPLNRISQWIEPIISDKGGMFVQMDGAGHDGNPKSLAWHLIASANHGPTIPCGASVALVRRLARGDDLPHAAMPCMGLLSVEQILEPLKNLDICELTP